MAYTPSLIWPLPTALHWGWTPPPAGAAVTPGRLPLGAGVRTAGRLFHHPDTPICVAAYAGIAVLAFFLAPPWRFLGAGGDPGRCAGAEPLALCQDHPAEKCSDWPVLTCGKGASFLGTMIVSVGTQLTGSAKVGVGSLLALFIIGFVLFVCPAGLGSSRTRLQG